MKPEPKMASGFRRDWVRKLILDIVTNSDDSAKHFVEELELWVKELKDKPWDEEDKKIAGQIQTHLSRNQNFREKVMIKCDLLKYLLKFVTSVPQGPIPSYTNIGDKGADDEDAGDENAGDRDADSMHLLGDSQSDSTITDKERLAQEQLEGQQPGDGQKLKAIARMADLEKGNSDMKQKMANLERDMKQKVADLERKQIATTDFERDMQQKIADLERELSKRTQGHEWPDQRDLSFSEEEEGVLQCGFSELVVPYLQVNRISSCVDVHRERQNKVQEEANEAQEETQP